MLYENYQKKMLRIAKVLSKCIKHFRLIAIAMAVIIVCVVSVLIAKGAVSGTTCAEQSVYGDSIEFTAKSFLSDIRFEFCAEGDDAWGFEEPRFPGKYKVRAVSEGAFGSEKRGRETAFEILEKDILVSIISVSIIYGETPSVSASTVEGDTLICTDFIYEDETLERVTVTPDLSSLIITDPEGKNVTSAYNITAQRKSLGISKRPITVTVDNAEAEFSGESFKYEKYEITSGSLKKGDSIRAVFNESLLYPGSVKNQPVLSIVDKNGRDVTECYKITEKIGNLSIIKKPLLITTESATLTYDGKAHTFDSYTLDGGEELPKGHSIKIVGRTSVKDVGEYKNTLVFSVVDENGQDMSDNYSFIIDEGDIAIEPRVIKVVTPSGKWTYNGQPHSSETVDRPDGIADGHIAVIRTHTTITDVGVKENDCSVMIMSGGENVTHNYEISYEYGIIECVKRPITIRTGSVKKEYSGLYVTSTEYDVISNIGLVPGHRIRKIESGGAIYVGKIDNVFRSLQIADQNGEDKTSNYEISYEYGTIEITKLVLDVRTQTKRWVYDGQEHYDDGLWIILGTLAAGDTFIVESSTKITDVGTAINKFEKYRIESKSTGEDRSENYELNFGYGELTVVPRPIIVKVPDSEKIYDSAPLIAGAPEVSHATYYPLVEGHKLVGTSSGSRTEAGESIAEITELKIMDGERDVTHNYEVIKETGKLTVRKRPVTVATATASKIYDGLPLTDNGYFVTDDSPYDVVAHHKLTMEVIGSQTEVGQSANRYAESSVKVTDGEKDVTSNYDITVRAGILEVRLYAYITVVAESDMKYYDGTPLKNSGYKVYITEGAIKDGHRLIVTVSGERTSVGVSSNKVTAYVVDGIGKDVSFEYKLTKENGNLTVKDETEDNVYTVAKIKTDKPDTLYLRKAAYGDYSGRVWQAAVSYGKTLPSGHNYSYLTALILKEQGTYIRAAEIKESSEFMLPYYAGTDGNYPHQPKDTVCSGNQREYTLSYYSSNFEQIMKLQGVQTEYEAYEVEYREFVYKMYLNVDDETRVYMEKVIAEQGFSLSDSGVIGKIARYVQGAAAYNKDFDPNLEREDNIAIAFLDTYQEGVCRHFATAATLIYRTLGIPARYVTGYMVNTVAGQFVDVTTPGHAWVEVYIDGIGWAQVEVTGSDPAEAPNSEKESIKITPSYVFKHYDGSPLYAEDHVDADAKLSELLRNGYTYSVKVIGDRTEVGRSESVIESFSLYDPLGNDVTEQFELQKTSGVIEVFPEERKVIRAYLYQLQKYYDGKPLSFEEGDYKFFDIEEGLNVNIDLDISLNFVGSISLAEINKNITDHVSFTVFKNGEDVTGDYSLVFDIDKDSDPYYVPIKIDKRAIEITSATESKVYDGKPLSNEIVTVTKGSLAEGDTLFATVNGHISEPGEIENVILPRSVKVMDKDGNDVTKNYSIIIKNGTLSIVK